MKTTEAEINVLLGKFGFGNVESYRKVMDAPTVKLVRNVAPVKTVEPVKAQMKANIAKKKAQAPPRRSKLKGIFSIGKAKTKKPKDKFVKNTITDFFNE